MRWLIDVDGVITTNPGFWSYWTYHLAKNGHKVFVLTARNPSRVNETIGQLAKWNICCDKIITMPDILPRDLLTQWEWKVKEAKKSKADVWVDDQFKICEQVFGWDWSKKIKNISMIRI